MLILLLAIRLVAVTIDDLPVAGPHQSLGKSQAMTRKLLRTLNKHKIPAIGFVNEIQLQEEGRVLLLRMWLDAGMTLGNHTYSHLRLQDTPLDQYEDDVIRGEAATRRLLEARGQGLKYFRHPFTSTGATIQVRKEFEGFLKARGYTVAPYTVENSDFLFNAVYGKDPDRVRRAYLNYTEAMFEYFERRSREALGYEPRQILLLHANQLNADSMEEMIVRLQKRGYLFVTLDGALEDPAYARPDPYAGPLGISWLHRWSDPEKHRAEPDPPKFVLEWYRAR